MSRVKFIKAEEPAILALQTSSKVIEGALYVATDTGSMWLGVSTTKLLQVNAANLDKDTTYTIYKSGSSIFFQDSNGNVTKITDDNTTYEDATDTTAGLMSAADKKKLDSIETGANKYVLPVATADTLGGVKVGANLSITEDGVLSASAKPIATISWDSVSGKPTFSTVAMSGSYNDLTDKPDIPEAYALPAATEKTLGGVKGGKNVAIADDGTMSVDLSAYATNAAVGDSFNSIGQQIGTANKNIAEEVSRAKQSEESLAGDIATNKQNISDLSLHKQPNTSFVGAAPISVKEKEAGLTKEETISLDISGPLTVSDGKLTVSAATADSAGSMSAADKTKLDEIDSTYVKKTGDTISGTLTIQGAAAGKPLRTRGITGLGDDDVDDSLYLQYGVDKPIYLGSEGAYSISKDGSTYTGKSATAGVADSANAVDWSNVNSKPTFAKVATSGSYDDLSGKPTIPTVPSAIKNPNALTISLNGTSQGAYDGSAAKAINVTAASVGAAAASHTHKKADISDFPTSMPASDVAAWAKAASKPSYNLSEIGGSLDVSKLSGVIDSSHLPSYVDDVLDGYLSGGKFYKTKNSNGTYSTELAAEAGKIYVNLNDNKTYRWSGSAYVVISETIALGETSSTAYYGDKGKIAYDHSQVTSGNPHKVTKADVGLGNVENKSSATIRGELTKANVTTALGYTPPTQDTNTTYAAGSGLSLSGTTFNVGLNYTTSGKNYKVQQDSSKNLYVNVPWTDNNTWTALKGATTSAAGTAGYAPAPAAGAANRYLRSDGTWSVPPDNNSWRGIQDNLTSSSTTDSLSANQGRILNGKFSSYVPTSRTINGKALTGNITLSANDVGAAASSHTHSYLPLSGGTMSGVISHKGEGSYWDSREHVAVNGTSYGQTAGHSYNPVVGQKTASGYWAMGNLSGEEQLSFIYITDANYKAQKNDNRKVNIPCVNGTVAMTSQIPSVGNGTVTIKQAGAVKGSFTMNQSGGTTIELTDNNTTYNDATTSAHGLMTAAMVSKLNGIAAGANAYSLPTASSSTLGGVKTGSNITNSSGTISLTKANVVAALGYTPPTSDTNTWRPEEVIVSSSQPSASTCKIWIKP